MPTKVPRAHDGGSHPYPVGLITARWEGLPAPNGTSITTWIKQKSAQITESDIATNEDAILMQFLVDLSEQYVEAA